MRHSRRGKLRILLLTAVLLTAAGRWFIPEAAAELVLRGAVVRIGFSPAVPADSIASLNFTVENPDPQEAVAVIQVEPDRAPGPVYSKTFRIGPKAILQEQMPICGAATENYKVTLFRQMDGRRQLIISDKTVTKLDVSSRNQVWLVNDDPEFPGYSDVAKDAGVTFRPVLITCRGEQVPTRWSGLTQAAAVILGRPDIEHLTQLQIRALAEYVDQGGVLIWSDPQAVLRAADSPLAGLLPVTPAGLRHWENLDPLRQTFALDLAAGKKRAAAAAPPAAKLLDVPVLEILPPATGRVALTCGGRPGTVWFRHGLGMIGVILFNPFQISKEDSTLTAPLWNHIFSQFPAAPAGAMRGGGAEKVQLLQQLNGFRIPSAALIRNLILGYSLAVLLLLGLAFRFRFQAAGWLLAGAAGLAATLLIFLFTSRLTVGRPTRSLTQLTFQGADAGRALPGEATLSLFSKSDLSPEVRPADPGAFFQPMAAVSRGGSGRSEDRSGTVLRVMETASGALLEGLSLQALRPRPFSLLFRPDGDTAAAAAAVPQFAAPPRLRHTAEGPRLDAVLTRLPDPAPRHAFLVLPGGALPLTLEKTAAGIRLTPAAPGQLQADTSLLTAQALLEASRLPVPCLALLSTGRGGRALAEMSPLPFEPYDYRFTLVPLLQTAGPGPLLATPELIKIDPLAQSASIKLILRDGQWQNSAVRGADERYVLDLTAPPPFRDMILREAAVQLDTANPGGNLDFTVKLQPAGVRDNDSGSRKVIMAAATGSELAAVRVENGRYEFKPGAAPLIHPHTGRLTLVIEPKPRRQTGPADVERANGWRILTLKVWLKGDAPTANPAEKEW